MTAYDPDNIFGKILKGEIPSHKVYEDDDTLAFMDVMPQSRGHTLVIPKTGSRNLFDAEPQVLANLIQKTQKVARAVMTAMDADGLRLAQFNEAPAGQTVFHLHFHIIPMYEGVPLRPHTGEMADQDELAAQAEKIRAAF
ncbi:HIT family protein [Pelagibacterium halotolerans]|uniref:Bis(5'-nucleosyl)-tetraphosphatase (Asymmetrical) n=1 Tax=Pelagibacterium halotolerans (strain DSM 22347 / JCM 15775 / CGMCC 1.7692 / B2) TaxID=1082931 RepID=G4RBY6_PELHB|nr:HIT family protein [Pelagibacterium halotolerans]AEQ51634.1 bis(5'-nucleosyl)-tetraphosphatase (asymmetrical) [Pelagibacterium halotolerans B2]QJR18538.1 HIT family protein [Pelagibacterium halotolerans]SEA18729.1 histidine triad (HIT) family protein [Pelagibacterium halotolerans]